jgi:hypothetical protein
VLRFRLSSDGAIDDMTIVRPQADRPPAWLKKRGYADDSTLLRNKNSCLGSEKGHMPRMAAKAVLPRTSAALRKLT